MKWEHRDTSNASFRTTNSAGASVASERAELDPTRSDAGVSNPYSGGGGLLSKMAMEYPGFGSSHSSGKSRCYVDRFEQDCEYALWLVGNGSAGRCPNNNCGMRHNPNRDGEGRGGWQMPYFTHGGFINVPLGPSMNPQEDPAEAFGRLAAQVLKSRMCDDRLARLFGGDDAVFATDRDPATLMDKGNKPHPGANRPRVKSEDPRNGVGHIYGNPTGSGSRDNYVFTPKGYRREEFKHYWAHINNPPKELQNYHRFYYSPGSLNRYGYSGGLVISFIHTGPTDRQGNPFPANPRITNDANSIAVGIIGGYGNVPNVGGNTDGFFVHTHIIFYKMTKAGKMGEKQDPRVAFCGDLGFK